LIPLYLILLNNFHFGDLCLQRSQLLNQYIVPRIEWIRKETIALPIIEAQEKEVRTRASDMTRLRCLDCIPSRSRDRRPCAPTTPC
jgi:hypothetical protein